MAARWRSSRLHGGTPVWRPDTPSKVSRVDASGVRLLHVPDQKGSVAPEESRWEARRRQGEAGGSSLASRRHMTPSSSAAPRCYSPPPSPTSTPRLLPLEVTGLPVLQLPPVRRNRPPPRGCKSIANITPLTLEWAMASSSLPSLWRSRRSVHFILLQHNRSVMDAAIAGIFMQ